jgi:hypothetical protein
VDVWEDKSRNQRSAYLSYSLEIVDPDSEVCETICDYWFCGGGFGDGGMGDAPPFPPEPGDPGECPDECTYSYCYYAESTYEYGWGEIPPGDFRANGRTAHVDTTVGDDSDFYVERCTSTPEQWSCTVEPGTPTAIRIDWSAGGMSSYSSTGTSTETWGPYSYRSHGSYRESSARAVGHLGELGFDGAMGNGWIGQSRGGSVQKSIFEGGDGDGDGDGDADAGSDTGGGGTGGGLPLPGL